MDKKINIGLKTYDDLFKDDKGRKTEEITPVDIMELKPYAEQPFKVLLDDGMNELCTSIEQYGVLSPVIVRPHSEGGYEILSGHRRVKACELLGVEEVPVVVKDFDDDTAAILLVDSNLQRENILPSEKAFAYKLKLEALKHQGKKLETTSRQIGTKSDSSRSDELISMNSDDSARQIQRFVRLNNLSPALMNLVDEGKLALTPAVEISYLDSADQEIVQEILERDQVSPSLSQAQKLRKLSDTKKINDREIDRVLTVEKPMYETIVFRRNKIEQFFPAGTTGQQIEKTIYKLLEQYRRQWQAREEKTQEQER